MTWTWRMEQADGTELTEVPDVAQPPFQNQSDAESWLGETFRELSDAGVAQVTLLEDGTKIYGPMSLEAD
ncbi:hypothetical protein [uncultured Jatrophihabitans sp.]|uniref:hypothetical protein n=1 Tax=uncultured Jatrophihabitans sp. TaxID=1610747 RepID=UPI0035CB3A09